MKMNEESSGHVGPPPANVLARIGETVITVEDLNPRLDADRTAAQDPRHTLMVSFGDSGRK